ncbi:MAG TPA: DNA-directed RNA polymerase subunit beta' [Candidatus Paceibacterota bacterium]|nr:DNA-directed RNA polymerase subunit beta' [Candidatus Paceibacterota bacterium]HRZ34508.1 DNA-directed RNA polymerase subunit beta' [Candidatus Paceibacterota bacterium]
MQRKTYKKPSIDKIFLRLASPDRILEWSHGEVTKPETVNYRTQRSEKNGLFDERIFGPERDYECYCGKYRGIRYKGIVCEKCGVEITRSIVRRERMGHITLASPVAHIWFLRSIPSRISTLLGMSSSDVEKVVYFAGYLVTEVNETEKKRILGDLESEYKNKSKTAQDEKTKEKLKSLYLQTKQEIDSLVKGQVLDEVVYHKFSMRYGSVFEAEIGAEAVFELFKSLNLESLLKNLEEQSTTATGPQKDKLNRRISLIRAMIKSEIRPEWMFLQHIPVIPPALRPMVALDGGRQATSDINDLYRRVINRNNRLKKLQDIGAPDVILRNEKRILQEAVDALVDNNIRHSSSSSMANQAQKRALKSLADNLKGKRGFFRGNLLGKRVDYSGRSVIVIGPDLALNQCGLPKLMALELFRPFIISKLLKDELAFNIRGAGRLIDEKAPEVWEILDEVIQNKYVLLNRAPTLHRLGIQAFKPVLIEGNAIQIHPLVCTAFNADFDGDQMAVHVPLSVVAQYEAREIMAADKNVLKPGSGDPVVAAKLLDILLGCFWMTKMVAGERGEGMRFPGPNLAMTAYDYGLVGLRAKVLVKTKSGTKYVNGDKDVLETTVGRIMFNSILPHDYKFINEEIDKKKMSKVVNDFINKYGLHGLPEILDKIKKFGFTYATTSGITWAIDDLQIPEGKQKIIEASLEEVKKVKSQYNEGLLSEAEKKRKLTTIWHEAKNKIEALIPATLDPNGPVYDMWKSGARGSLGQITNMAGMKGLIVNSRGEEIETPILSNSKEGFSPIEYFTSTHGSRKGLTDTALNTARAGYLTRRLFDVAQDIVVREKDCKTKKSITIKKRGSDSGIEISLSKKIRGRVLAEDLKDDNGKKMFEKGHLISKDDAQTIEDSNISEIKVRSPLTCETSHGVCSLCYGMDLGNDEIVDLGEAVGTVAAQAIGEPGTQLTMRTFHAGGTASVGGDITQGLPRVEEVFERRKPKSPCLIAKTDGIVSEIREEGKDKIIVISPKEGGKTKSKKNSEYVVTHIRTPLVKVGDEVLKGQMLTDGSADIAEIFKYAGRERAEEYIIHQINKVYELQGESVSRKHIELIVRQMFSRVKVIDGGDTKYTVGDVVNQDDLIEENRLVSEDDGMKAKAEPIVLGITEVSLSRKSFLSAASFQHTTKVLINSAIRGAEDNLTGLKENVILGRLIPAGTGFSGSKKHEEAKKIEEAALAEYETARAMEEE